MQLINQEIFRGLGLLYITFFGSSHIRLYIEVSQPKPSPIKFDIWPKRPVLSLGPMWPRTEFKPRLKLELYLAWPRAQCIFVGGGGEVNGGRR